MTSLNIVNRYLVLWSASTVENLKEAQFHFEGVIRYPKIAGTFKVKGLFILIKWILMLR